MLAGCLRCFLDNKWPTPPPWADMSKWHGAADAGAKGPGGSVSVGGWFSDLPHPSQEEVYWFSWTLTKDTHPWAFADGGSNKIIMALELYATLVMLYYMLPKASMDGGANIFIPYCTDNEGSAYCVLNDKTRKWPASAVIMEILLQAQQHAVQLAPAHVKREFNQWADDLVNGKTNSFAQSRRVRPDLEAPKWHIFEVLLAMHQPT